MFPTLFIIGSTCRTCYISHHNCKRRYFWVVSNISSYATRWCTWLCPTLQTVLGVFHPPSYAMFNIHLQAMPVHQPIYLHSRTHSEFRPFAVLSNTGFLPTDLEGTIHPSSSSLPVVLATSIQPRFHGRDMRNCLQVGLGMGAGKPVVFPKWVLRVQVWLPNLDTMP